MRFGGLIAPATFVRAFTTGHFPEIVDEILPFRTTLHSDDFCWNYRVIRPGDRITASELEIGALEPEGAQHATETVTLLFLLPESAPSGI